MNYRVVDYRNLNGEWINTDEGGAAPTDADIEDTPELSLGWEDEDGNWHYRWVDGPFSDDFGLEDAIIEIASEYDISIAGV